MRQRFLADESGVSATEYALIIVMIALTVVVVMVLFGKELGMLFNKLVAMIARL